MFGKHDQNIPLILSAVNGLVACFGSKCTHLFFQIWLCTYMTARNHFSDAVFYWQHLFFSMSVCDYFGGLKTHDIDLRLSEWIEQS